MTEEADVTQILAEASKGDASAFDRLFPIVYQDLRRLAQKFLMDERPDHTMQATALVHEAYLRLVDQTRIDWGDRVHFFAVAARAIRRILVDHARRGARIKRGGAARNVNLDDVADIGMAPDPLVLEIDDALSRLAEENAEAEKVVELRFFGGLTNEEAAAVLDMSPRTVDRRWRFGRAWLYRHLSGEVPS